MVAIVKREIDRAFGAGKQQALANRIFADCVHGFVVGDAGHDQLPALASIVRPVNVGTQVIEAKPIDRGVDGIRVEVRGIQLCDLAPGGELLGRHVLPVLSARHASRGEGHRRFLPR